MMVDVPLDDTVNAGNAFGSGSEGYIVGSPPVWKDDSTATYASFAGQYAGPLNPQFVGAAGAHVSAAASAEDTAGGTAIIVRYQVAAAGPGTKLPTVRLTRQGGDLIFGYPTGEAPTSASWVEVTMDASSIQLEVFLSDPTAWELTLLAPGYDSAVETVPNGIQRWNVYEARLTVLVPIFDAPPCRLHPRSDGLGVGGGRNYPPPRSQQRSLGHRGVGYY